VHYILLATHSAEVCPTSNAAMRKLLTEMGPKIPGIAEKVGVTIVAGPYVNREHLTVAIVESDDAEKVDRFIVEARLAQWNTVRILPSKSIQEGMAELADQPAIF
jgi:uncharacterized protein with GYD domain